MVSRIWGIFIIVGIVYCLLTNQIQILNDTILGSASKAFDLTVKIFPVMALWLGISKIAEKSGLLTKISYKLSFVLKHVFPDIPRAHPSFSYISSNIIANMFGLGNAATPFGLKAMNSLQELNKNKEVASRSMITFLVLNTSGITIIPTTIISLRMAYKSVNATGIVGYCIIISVLSTLIALIIDRLFARRKKCQK